MVEDGLILVIFGASGDLTSRKLVPAMYNLFRQGLLPEKFAILGVSRSEYSDQTFTQKLLYANEQIDADIPDIKEFEKRVFYLKLNTENISDYSLLSERLKKLDESLDMPGNYVFYLSTPPSLFITISNGLSKHKLNEESNRIRRIVIEKPFGYNLNSAINLNKKLHQCFKEDQIYRIDHYLGKETVQNLLVTRFSNSIFEPLWNRNFIHHIEISAAESVGVEGRGGYYDNSGAMRDMVQNHLMQLAALIAMEPPVTISEAEIRNEKVKVFQSVRPFSENDFRNNVIRGQYIDSKIRGKPMPGYRDEAGVDSNSKTETFLAMKFFIDNWRWADVPFYIRTGKRLPTRVSEVVIHFKKTPHRLFHAASGHSNQDNVLVIRIQPDEGILLKLGVKIPGAGYDVENVNMNFHYADLSEKKLPEAYERLLLDCFQGDATLYARGDAVEGAWKFIDPIIESWQTDTSLKIYGYPAGTWGPENADELIEGKEMAWRYPCKNLTDDGNYCEL